MEWPGDTGKELSEEQVAVAIAQIEAEGGVGWEMPQTAKGRRVMAALWIGLKRQWQKKQGMGQASLPGWPNGNGSYGNSWPH